MPERLRRAERPGGRAGYSMRAEIWRALNLARWVLAHALFKLFVVGMRLDFGSLVAGVVFAGLGVGEPDFMRNHHKRCDSAARIFLKVRKDCIKIDVGEHDQLYALYDTLENGPSTDERFFGFTNEDGEQFMVNIEELMLLEAPTHVVNAGRKEVSDDLHE